MIKFRDRYPVIIDIVTWIIRIFLGALFIFSGMTKGIDVWGTFYKFREYFGALGFEVWDALNLVGVFILCLLEFLTGIFLLLGCFRRATPIIAAIIMAFMLPLTLWLAIAEPIKDCGCFGEAITLTNWQTFWKNVVICVGVVWLLFYNRFATCIITPYLQWIGAVVSGLYFLTISIIGYYYQPLIDFRPYPVGSTLVNLNDETGEDSEDEYLIFVYEKDGQKKEFTIDDEIPDEADGWTFVEQKTKEPEYVDEEVPVKPVKEETEKNIRFYSEDGHEDLTHEIVGEGKQLILMIPTLSEVPAARTWKINSFYQWAQANDIDMLATVGGNPKEIEQWKDIALPEYEIYTSDDTSIEEVVRGNPAVVYLEDGVIKWKSSLRAIDIDDFQNPEVNSDPMSFAHNDRLILMNITWVYLAVMLVLIVLSFSAKGLRFIFRKSKPTEEENEENTERVSPEEKVSDSIKEEEEKSTETKEKDE